MLYFELRRFTDSYRIQTIFLRYTMAITSRTEGDVVVAGFDEAKMLDEALINEVGEELGQLANENEGGKLLIENDPFPNLERLYMSLNLIDKPVRRSIRSSPLAKRLSTLVMD